MSFKKVLLTSLLIFVLFGAYSYYMYYMNVNYEEYVIEEPPTDFYISVKAPTEVKVGQRFALQASMIYVGERPLHIYGGPTTMSFHLNGDGDIEMMSTGGMSGDIGLEYTIEPGYSIYPGRYYKINDPGEYTFYVQTNFKYYGKKQEVTMEPITIRVIDKHILNPF